MEEYVINGSLWCRNTPDGILVINGGWYGFIDGSEFVSQDYPDVRIPYVITWKGKHRFHDTEYSEMLQWASEQPTPTNTMPEPLID